MSNHLLPLSHGTLNAIPPGHEIISAASPSGVASFDINWGDTEFEEVNILIDQWAPVTTGVPVMVSSSDDGSTFDTGASNYMRTGCTHNPDGTVNAYSGASTSMFMCYNSANGRMLGGTTIASFLIQVLRPYDTGLRTNFIWWGGFDRNVVSNSMNFNGAGYRDTAAKVNAVRLYQDVGNISARYVAWGQRRA